MCGQRNFLFFFHPVNGLLANHFYDYFLPGHRRADTTVPGFPDELRYIEPPNFSLALGDLEEDSVA